MSEVETVQFRLNGFCCWLRQHVLRGVGPVPSAACGPTRGSARLAAGRGSLEQLRNYLLGGWQGRAWGLSPEAWAPQDTRNLRVPRRRGFLAPLLSPRLGFLRPKFWPLWLLTLPGFQEAVPALRSDESALRSATDRRIEGGGEEQRMKSSSVLHVMLSSNLSP